MEARGHGIRINALSPGFIRTRMQDSFMGGAEGKATSEAAQKSWELYHARQGRAATPIEIGDAVVCLSSPRMSFVVAHNLVVDK